MMTKSPRYLAFILISVGLTGCFDSDDDDDDMSPNQAPTADEAMYTTEADTAFDEMLTGSDPDGDDLTFALAQEPMSGSVDISEDGSFTYTPAPQFTGTDSFVFSVSDGIADPVEAIISITIENQQVSFTDYTRNAFNQDPTDEPLPVNGRAFTQDADDAAFDDLLIE